MTHTFFQRALCLGAAPLAALLISTTALADASAPVAKQLAGPPSEFEAHRLPAARKGAIHSTSALLPVELERTRSGNWQWQTRLTMDGERPAFIVFSGEDSSWQPSVSTGRDAPLRNAEQLATESGLSEYGMGNQRFPATAYRFDDAPGGQWVLQISSENPFEMRGFVLASSDSPWQLVSWQQDRNQWVGERLTFLAETGHATDRNAGTARIGEAWLHVTGPDGVTQRIDMLGSAASALGREGAGALSGSFVPEQAGDFTVQVHVRGRLPDGQAFVRTAEHAIAVIHNDIAVDRSAVARGQVIDENRLHIDLGMASQRSSGFYRAHAEVWGRIGRAEVPVAWIGGMVPAGQLGLSLDSRWIALAGAEGPFELRNVRIEDPDHFIPLVRLDRVAMDVARLPDGASRVPDGIDEAMRMGPRPDAPEGPRNGGRLMLVHGYCSGDAWGPLTGQFASSAKFQDFNQNRSHDAFARRIRDFGNQFGSFGIVAHSQGGAAATHLYTYYWSGLDWASPGRLIQSVGTPYQGTALAGNLAAIGNVFGVGCGTNNNLTYSGASSWLAGIPYWARSRVNYYTTSFATAWWRWDYCNIATDLLLSDPEDGTTERAYGQLPGAYNRGHKTGWCHTSGMRDPAQVTDASRNSVMNANAAR